MILPTPRSLWASSAPSTPVLDESPELLVLSAELSRGKVSKYQGIDADAPCDCPDEMPDCECFQFLYWFRYTLKDIEPVKGPSLQSLKIVMASHTKRAGKYLFVLTELEEEEKRRFKASHFAVHASPIWEAACLPRALSAYMGEDALSTDSAFAVQFEKERLDFCYDVDELTEH